MYMCILQTYNYICVIYLDSFRQLESSVTIIFGKSIKYLFLFFSSKHVPSEFLESRKSEGSKKLIFFGEISTSFQLKFLIFSFRQRL